MQILKVQVSTRGKSGTQIAVWTKDDAGHISMDGAVVPVGANVAEAVERLAKRAAVIASEITEEEKFSSPKSK